MEKRTAIGMLNSVKNNALCIYRFGCLIQKNIKTPFNDNNLYVLSTSIAIGKAHSDPQAYVFSSEAWNELLQDPSVNMGEELVKLAIRTLVEHSEQVLTMYVKATDQYKNYQQAPWFDFLKLMRNAVAHNFRISNPDNRYNLPASFKNSGRNGSPIRNKVISEEMLDREIEFNFFGHTDAIDLHDEIRTFVIENLN